jgi:protein phosphatase
VEFGAHSRRSPLRAVNEDHYLVLHLGRHQETIVTSLPETQIPRRFDESAYGMLVADGSGASGEIASRLAITTLAQLLVNFGRWNVRIDESIAHEVMDRAKRFYRGVDSTLLQAGRDSPHRLQTTLTAVFTAGTDLFFAHVGHSRAYLFRDNELLPLTRDHTVASERQAKATIVDVGDAARDLRHILTDVLGKEGAGGPKIDIERCGLLDSDVVLLCTNGLTDVADDSQIGNALRTHRTPDDQCSALVNLAVNSGSHDDVTAVVAHYRIPG